MKDFFNKTWVKITSWIFLLVGAVALILGGTSVADIGNGVELVAGIITAVGLLVEFIREMLNKKDTQTK
jgi:hypothetical protein